MELNEKTTRLAQRDPKALVEHYKLAYGELDDICAAVRGGDPMVVQVTQKQYALEEVVRALIVEGNKEIRRDIAGAVVWALRLRVKPQRDN